MSSKYSFVFPLLFAMVMVMGILFGFELNERLGSKKPISSKSENSRLDEILRLIEVKYVDTINGNDLVNGAIVDMLKELDPHSYFIPASDLQGVNESLEGNFQGIGIEFYIVKDTIIVVSPISGGPSEALGIRSGDKIIMIEDTMVAGVNITNDQVVSKLRGEKGTEVTISIARSGERDLLEFTIIRDKIPLVSVDVGYMVDDSVGYIKINRFSGTTYKEFMSQLNKLKLAGMTYLILDLRQNPGGYLSAATMIADEFIEGRGILVYTEGKAYARNDYTAKVVGDYETGRLAIMIDEGSASASEILAGAIQDYDRGLIVGRRSFGKGLVQEQYDLQDGSALRLTVARYFTPSGRCIQRPYDDGAEEYYHELDERYTNGEYWSLDSLSLADSLVFRTSKGRPVYGSGGILPDIFVPLDTAYDWRYMNKLRTYIPQFVYTHFASHQVDFESYRKSTYLKENFAITDDVFAAFIEYAENEGLEVDFDKVVNLETRTRAILTANFARQIWKEEGYYPAMNSIDSTFIYTYRAIKNFNGFRKVKRED